MNGGRAFREPETKGKKEKEKQKGTGKKALTISWVLGGRKKRNRDYP